MQQLISFKNHFHCAVIVFLLAVTANATILVNSGKYDTKAIVILVHGAPTAVFNPGTRSELRVKLLGDAALKIKALFAPNDLAKSFRLTFQLSQSVSNSFSSAQLDSFTLLSSDEIPPRVGNNFVPEH